MEPLPVALHGENTDVTANPRKLNIEGKIDNQLDRIGYLRSIGEDWTEPLFHLRDLVVGLEDDEFWNGVPERLEGQDLSEDELKEYHSRGWNGVEIDVELMEDSNGGLIEEPCPTPQQLSQMLRIIMALFARTGMSWRSTVNDEIPTHMPVSDD